MYYCRLKLVRYAGIFNKTNWILFIIGCVFMLLAMFFGDYEFKYRDIVVGILVVVIFIIIDPFSNSTYIELEYNMISYPDTYAINNKHGRGGTYIKGMYHVKNISHFELQQNALERLFGVAHIVFMGETEFEAYRKTNKVIIPREKHCIYGIPLKKQEKEISDFIKTLDTLKITVDL